MHRVVLEHAIIWDKWWRKAAEPGDERAKKFLELTEEDATK